MKIDETIIASIKDLNKEDQKKPYLTFVKGALLGQIHEIKEEPTTVGRSSECSLWIEDSAISRKHFQIHIKSGEVIINDLKSTNGTYVNGEKVISAAIYDGDKIQISQDTVLEITYLDSSRVHSERLRYEMGVKDPVTNTYNKRYFLDRVQEEFAFAKRKHVNLALVMFDLDHFKMVNDTYGHLAGDLVLQKVAQIVSGTVREGDIFARFGGEEFVIVMREANIKNALDLAERIRNLISQAIIIHDDQKIKITISCGLAEVEESHKDYLDLIAMADQYLYRAKKQGRNRTCCAKENLSA
ncbi:MAG: FHA/GGDEF protein [uncultured bacterium]|nr:MAG: FHA/GGDEF protein [uncultured bacterium]